MHVDELARNKLTNEGLRKQFGNTRLKSGDIGPMSARQQPPTFSTSLLYPSYSPLVVTKLATGKEVLRKLYYSQGATHNMFLT